MIKAIFFDVDGTLFSHVQKSMPERTKEALDRVRKQGIRCVLATGRHRLELESLHMTEFAFDGYITLNGQLCLDNEGEIFSSNAIQGTQKETILQLFREKTVPIMLIEKDKMYLNFVNREVVKAQNAISTEIPETGIETGEPIYQAIAYIKEEQEQWLRKRLPGCEISRWNPYAVDIVASGGSKVSGIKEYLSKMQIRREETMAFGDGENDIQMLAFAQTGVAMGNAGENVKQVADFVTKGIEEDGILYALEHYGILE